MDYRYVFIYKFKNSPHVWGHKFDSYQAWRGFELAFEELNKHSPDQFGGVEVLFSASDVEPPADLAARAEPFTIH